MNAFPYINKRTAIATAIAVTLGSAAPLQTASAQVFTFSWDSSVSTEGLFTMLNSLGATTINSSYPYAGDSTWGLGKRTQITGTLTYDTSTGAGTMTIEPFDFFGSGPAVAHDITIQAIGDGVGGAGNLIAGGMLFDWNSNNNINVGIIFDATGMLNAIGGGLSVGDTVTGGATPASDASPSLSTIPVGPAPLATTTWNTDFNVNPGCAGTDTCLTSNDTIGGSPMDNGPFPGFSANFDIITMTVTSDGAGPTFTAPADPNQTEATAVAGDIVPVDLGTATNVLAPAGDPTCTVTVEYDIGNGWTADDGTNTENVTLTGTVTTLTVDWRATTTAGDPGTCASSTVTTATQTVTITIGDTTAPTFTTVPADFSVSVNSTAETIAFEGPTSGHGTVAASDAVDPTPLVEWSLDQLNWTTNTVGDESSNGFGAGANTVYWRVTDDAGNATTYTQQVTVNLPSGIVGTPCTVDPDLLNAAIGNRAVTGVFKMRDSLGNPVGEIDETVTGTINTATVCADESCTDSGAALATTQAFFGNLWDTETIRLFGQGTYTFDTCPGTIDANGNGSDGSIRCDADNALSMTVGPNQLGGHMLFNWSVNRKIDVAVVWEYSCGSAQLVAADPDGDGIIGTKMVDGPFKGFNAAFDLKTAAGVQPITTGGYRTTIPAVNNPVANTSPLPVDPGTIGTALGGVVISGDDLSGWGASDDSRVVRSCVGGCFDFTVSGRTPGETVYVVLPLSEPIPYYSLYRKYNAGTDSWTAYVVNNTDSVKTAPLDANGRCPEPGAGDYASYSTGILAGMLRPNDQCVQLTITDNGPNDGDPANGVIADPSGVGVTSAPATPEAITSGGGCTLSATQDATQRLDLWLLAGLMGLLGLRRKAQS